jgi:hypothetical protein
MALMMKAHLIVMVMQKYQYDAMKTFEDFRMFSGLKLLRISASRWPI